MTDGFITKVAATELINKSRGRVFSVTFRKKDKSLRKMNCRMGVKKGITGKGMAYEPALRGLKSVFDMQKKDYRMINLEKMTQLAINKKVYDILG